ncbi:MAG TPA: porin, partial [Gallionella sp.]|nr:porin [Gallionella sp.]
GTRNTYGVLTSDHFGTIRLGRYDTPYKVSTRKFDLFGDTLFDTRALTGGAAGFSSAVAFDGRPTNTVNYLSPSFNGFTVNAAYAAEAEGLTTSAQTKGKLWSIAGTYDVSPFYATLAYQEHNFGTVSTGSFGAQSGAPSGSSEKATKVGLGYDIDAFNFGFAYEKTSDDEAAGGADRFGHNSYYLSGKYTFGTDALRVAYTKAGQVGSIANSEAKLYSIGYDHNLSKRTTLYAAYGALKNGSGIAYPLTFANGTGASAPSGFGAKVSGLSFGMNHAF